MTYTPDFFLTPDTPILDPACGTGGFLLSLIRTLENLPPEEIPESEQEPEK